MDIRPAGAGSPATEITPLRAAGHGGSGVGHRVPLPLNAPPSETALIRELSEADAGRLMRILQAPLPSPKSAVPAHPDHAETVSELVQVGGAAHESHADNRSTVVARMDAQGKIATARDVLDHFRPERIGDWNAKPETLLRAATDLYETGGYANYVRSGDVAQLIIDNMRFVSFPVASEPVLSAKKTGWGAGLWIAGRRRPELSVSFSIAILLAVLVLAYLLLR